MLIPLINPSRRKNPIVFKQGQESIMSAFRKYSKRRLSGSTSRTRRLVRAAKAGRSELAKLYASIKNPKKRPATRRGSHSQQEGSMVYSLKRRPRRRSHRRARRNPYREAGFLSRLTGGSKKRSRRRRAHRRIRLGAHRPVIIRSVSGWRRPKRSKLFRRPTRINPRRSHRRYRRNPLGLPKLPFNLQSVAIGGAKIAGGIALGMLGMPLVEKHIAPLVDKTGQYRKFYGLFHIVVGAVAASMIRKQIVKELALTVAGVGVYDLISQNFTMLNLPKIGLAGDMEQPGVIGMEADYAPALGSSYQTALGASYGADDISYGSDDADSLDC